MNERVSTGKVRKLHGAFTFRVEGYSGLPNGIGASTESPEFELCGHVWQLRLFPGGSLEAHRGYLSFYLASKSSMQARASYKLSIACQKAGGEDETFSSSGIRVFEAKGLQVDGWGRDKFINLSTLNDEETGFIMNDRVIFKVNICVCGELETTGFPVMTNMKKNNSYTSLARSMYSLLKDDSGDSAADIMLIVGSKRQRIPAHRAILQCRSPVFKAMLGSGCGFECAAHSGRSTPSKASLFLYSMDRRDDYKAQETKEMNENTTEVSVSGDTEVSMMSAVSSPATPLHLQESKQHSAEASPSKPLDVSFTVPSLQPHSPSQHHYGGRFLESDSGEVVIPDVEPDVMQELLTFMYTDACSSEIILDTLGASLLIAAAKYQVTTLFNFVADYLTLQVDVSTCIMLLDLADAYDSIKLKEKCLQVMRDNPTEVSRQAEYEQLTGSLRDIVYNAVDVEQRQVSGCCSTGFIGRRNGRSKMVVRSSTGEMLSELSATVITTAEGGVVSTEQDNTTIVVQNEGDEEDEAINTDGHEHRRICNIM